MANPFSIAAQQTIRVGQRGAEVEAEVDPVGIGGGEDEGIARPSGECKVVRDGVHLVDELARFGSGFEDQFPGGQNKLLNRFRVGLEEFEVLRIWGPQAHAASLSVFQLFTGWNRRVGLKGSGRSTQGRRIRQYKISREGRRQLTVEKKNWTRIVEAMNALLESAG